MNPEKEIIELARRDPLVFAQYVDPHNNCIRTKFHEHLYNTVLADFSVKKKIINAPPRHGKTTSVLMYYLWLLGSMHTAGRPVRIAYVSYGTTLSDEKGGYCRQVLESDEFQKVFPAVQILKGANRVNNMEIKGGSALMFGGVTKGITGKGFDILILDDVHKDYIEAHSKAMRRTVINQYNNTLSTRLQGLGVTVLIMTRWHAEDLAGYLLSKNSSYSDKFKLYNYQAICTEKVPCPMGRKPGEVLCPDHNNFGPEVYKQRREQMGAYQFGAQYQGDPTAHAGSVLSFDNIKQIYSFDLPKNMKWYRYYDLAFTEETYSDYTAGWQCAIHAGDVYFRRLERWQGTWHKTKQKIQEIHDKERVPICIEKNNAGVIALEELKKVIRGVPVTGVYHNTGDKLARANPLIDKLLSGQVYLVKDDCNDITVFKEELEGFNPDTPAPHDDTVDAAAGAFEFAKKNHYAPIEFKPYG